MGRRRRDGGGAEAEAEEAEAERGGGRGGAGRGVPGGQLLRQDQRANTALLLLLGAAVVLGDHGAEGGLLQVGQPAARAAHRAPEVVVSRVGAAAVRSAQGRQGRQGRQGCLGRQGAGGLRALAQHLLLSFARAPSSERSVAWSKVEITTSQGSGMASSSCAANAAVIKTMLRGGHAKLGVRCKLDESATAGSRQSRDNNGIWSA